MFVSYKIRSDGVSYNKTHWFQQWTLIWTSASKDYLDIMPFIQIAVYYF